REAGDVARGAAELDRDPDLAHRALRAGLGDLDDHLTLAYELGGERLVELEQRLQAAVVLARERLPLVARARAEDLDDLGVRVGARPLELRGDQILSADAPAPRLPELRLERAQRHPAVGTLVGAVADERT